MNVSDAIHTKRAVREYSDRKLPEEIVNRIVNAGRRAQSAKNTQPWHFIVIQKDSTLKSLSELGNWAGHIAGASMAVAIVTPHPDTRFSVMFDAGQSAAYMQLAAWELGIGSCLATIYETEKARELLGFPEEQHLRISISFGYPIDETSLVRPPVKGGRKPFNEVVHWEHW
jgi:nitroreductase